MSIRVVLHALRNSFCNFSTEVTVTGWILYVFYGRRTQGLMEFLRQHQPEDLSFTEVNRKCNLGSSGTQPICLITDFREVRAGPIYQTALYSNDLDLIKCADFLFLMPLVLSQCIGRAKQRIEVRSRQHNQLNWHVEKKSRSSLHSSKINSRWSEVLNINNISLSALE